jgi:hypothetical protein
VNVSVAVAPPVVGPTSATHAPPDLAPPSNRTTVVAEAAPTRPGVAPPVQTAAPGDLRPQAPTPLPLVLASADVSAGRSAPADASLPVMRDGPRTEASSDAPAPISATSSVGGDGGEEWSEPLVTAPVPLSGISEFLVVRSSDAPPSSEADRPGPSAAPALEKVGLLTDFHPGGMERLTAALDGLFHDLGRATRQFGHWICDPHLTPWLLAAAAASLELARRAVRPRDEAAAGISRLLRP